MSEWISVEDRLPKGVGEYLVCWVTDCGYSGRSVVNILLGCWVLADDMKVTHWMPLPEPPHA